MKVCENCKEVFPGSVKLCPDCGNKLSVPEITDDYLKKFLEINDSTLARFKLIRQQTIEEAKNRSQKSGPLQVLGISGSARSEFDTPAENSNSEFLLNEALKKAEILGAKTELVALRDYDIRPCKCCYSTTNAQCHFYCSCYPKGTPAGDDMSNIMYDKILGADIIIFATPVNNFKIASHMSLFLDRCISLDGSLTPADPVTPKNKELNIKHTKFIELMADPEIPGSGFLRRFVGKTAGVITTGHEEGASMVISQLFMTVNHFGMAFPPFSNMYAMATILRGTYVDKQYSTTGAFIEEAKDLARDLVAMARLLRKENPVWRHDYSSN